MFPSYKKKHSKNQKNVSPVRVKSGKILTKIVIGVIAVFAALFFLYENRPLPAPVSESLHLETLKDVNGDELTTDEIIEKFNSFMNKSADTLQIEELSFIKELSFIPGQDQKNDVYVNQDKNISISMFTPNGRKAVSAVSVISNAKGKPSSFINCCLGFMSIFTPTMKPEIRQKVLLDMMGCTESGDIRLIDENTYIIGETKYTFTHPERDKFGMLIEQMPKLEQYSGDISDLLKR